jgi:nucleoside-diphosphate-sugar epimerase
MMNKPSIIVLGGTGLIGSALCEHFGRAGHQVIAINSRNYAEHRGAQAEVLINCNGNSYRYKAAQDPYWDFEASVLSVQKSLFDFKFKRYFYFSTVDVYNNISDPAQNHEQSAIDTGKLHPYGFHKWLAERLVERFAERSLILRTGTVLGPGMKKGPLFDLAQGQPLRMAIDSELSLIDTATIARATAQFIAASPAHCIINLTGTGFARLRELCAGAGLNWQLAADAEQVTYRYNVCNDRLRQLFPVGSSMQIAMQFFQRDP